MPSRSAPTDSIWISTGSPRVAGHQASALAGPYSSGAPARGRSPLGRSDVRTTPLGDPGSYHFWVPPGPTGSYALPGSPVPVPTVLLLGKAVEHEVVRHVGHFGV